MKPNRISASERTECLVVVYVAVGILLIARFGLPWAMRHPQINDILLRPCALSKHFGLPCPLCGGTRAAILTARGEWLRAFLLNPAATSLIAGSSAATIFMGASAITSRDLGIRWAKQQLMRALNVYVLLGLVAALWATKIALDCGFGIS